MSDIETTIQELESTLAREQPATARMLLRDAVGQLQQQHSIRKNRLHQRYRDMHHRTAATGSDDDDAAKESGRMWDEIDRICEEMKEMGHTFQYEIDAAWSHFQALVHRLKAQVDTIIAAEQQRYWPHLGKVMSQKDKHELLTEVQADLSGQSKAAPGTDTRWAAAAEGGGGAAGAGAGTAGTNEEHQWPKEGIAHRLAQKAKDAAHKVKGAFSSSNVK